MPSPRRVVADNARTPCVRASGHRSKVNRFRSVARSLNCRATASGLRQPLPGSANLLDVPAGRSRRRSRTPCSARSIASSPMGAGPVHRDRAASPRPNLLSTRPQRSGMSWSVGSHVFAYWDIARRGVVDPDLHDCGRPHRGLAILRVGRIGNSAMLSTHPRRHETGRAPSKEPNVLAQTVFRPTGYPLDLRD
jgi:hypothetical protein